MSSPCEHAVYLPSGLVNTPMGTCDCDRTPNVAQEKADLVVYAKGMMRAHHPGRSFPWEKRTDAGFICVRGEGCVPIPIADIRKESR